MKTLAKRFIFVSLLCCLTATFHVNAQNTPIPNTVFSLTLGKSYSDNEIKDTMLQKHSLSGTFVYSGAGEYKTKKFTFSSNYGYFSFGGLEWEFVDAELHNGILFFIQFVRHFNSYAEAVEQKDILLRKLQSKYGTAHYNEMWFWYNSENDIFLEVKRVQGMNERYYYYLVLTYDKSSIMDKIAKLENDEL